jgi:hypothetical protein
MITDAKIQANRLNAQHSTGPRTPQGKARVARNALRHGLLSDQVVLPTEDREEFEVFRDSLLLDLAALGTLEQLLADRYVAQSWRLRRVFGMEACLLDRDQGRSLTLEHTMHLEDVRPEGASVHPAALGEALATTLGAKHCPYETLRRYERTIQHDLDSCLSQLEHLQQSRNFRRHTVEEAAQVRAAEDRAAEDRAAAQAQEAAAQAAEDLANAQAQEAATAEGRGNGEQGTGNGDRGLGNREQGTGNGEMGIGNGEGGTGNRESDGGFVSQGSAPTVEAAAPNPQSAIRNRQSPEAGGFDSQQPQV